MPKPKAKKFKLADKLCNLIKYAATVAKGNQELYLDGEYCLWGEVAHRVGVTNRTLSGVGIFSERARISAGVIEKLSRAERAVLACKGYGAWDDGNPKRAISTACEAAAGMTIGQFKSLMMKTKLLLPQKKKK